MGKIVVTPVEWLFIMIISLIKVRNCGFMKLLWQSVAMCSVENFVFWAGNWMRSACASVRMQLAAKVTHDKVTCFSYVCKLKVTKIRLFSAQCLPICMRLTAGELGMDCLLIFGGFTKICRHSPVLVKIEQQYDTLHEDLYVFLGASQA
jgi:hypothetical protein